MLVSSYSLTPLNSGARLEYSGHVEAGFPLFGQIGGALPSETWPASFARSWMRLIDKERTDIHNRWKVTNRNGNVH